MSSRLMSLFIFVCLILLTINYCFTLPPYGRLEQNVPKVKKIKCVNHTKDIFDKVDRRCEDCYDLFRDVDVYNKCREKCFGTVFFPTCLETLLILDEKPKYLNWILQLHNSSNANISWPGYEEPRT